MKQLCQRSRSRRFANGWLVLAMLAWLLATGGWLIVRSDGAGGRPLATAWGYDPAFYDPHQTTDPVAYSVFRHVCETLFYEDFDGRARGWLAEDEVEYTGDGRRLLVRLRPGITFHDGAPLTADAVQASFARLQELGVSPLADDLGGVEIIARDEHTVEFRLPATDYDFARLVLSNPYAVIVLPNVASSERQLTDAGFVACTGAYRFAPELYRTGESLSLVRNADYRWPPAYFDNRGPAHIHQLDFLFQADAEERLALLLQGEVCVLSLNPEQVEQVDAQLNFRLLDASGGVTYLGFNFLQPRWQDVRVRQAVAMAMNKEELAALGPFDIANTPLSQAMTGYDPAAADFAYGYDPVRSRELLAELDFTGDEEVVLLIPESNTYRRIADVVQRQLAAVGLRNVRLREVPRADISSQRQDFDLLLYDYAWGNYTALSIFFGPTPRNLLAYPNGAVADLARQACSMTELEARRSLLLTAQSILLQDAVMQPLLVRQLTFAVDDRCVRGEAQSPFGEVEVHDARTR